MKFVESEANDQFALRSRMCSENRHHIISNKKRRQKAKLMKKLSEAALSRSSVTLENTKTFPTVNNIVTQNVAGDCKKSGALIPAGDATCHSTEYQVVFKRLEYRPEVKQCRTKEAEEWFENYRSQMLSLKDTTHVRQIWNQVSYVLVGIIAFVELVSALLVDTSTDYTIQIGFVLFIITINTIVQEGYANLSAVQITDAIFKHHKPQANSSKIFGDQCGPDNVPSDDDDDIIVFEAEIQSPLFEDSIHHKYSYLQDIPMEV